MFKNWIAPMIIATALAGCGAPFDASLTGAMGTGLVGAVSMHGHGLGFRFGAGRPMNPFEPALFRGGSLPSQVDNRAVCSPIADQGQLGSCTAFAIGRGLREYLENKEANQVAQQQPFGGFVNLPLRAGAAFTTLSALQLYYNERVIDGDPEQDAGSTMTTGMTVL
ncbi:MAG: hypothetical protein KGR26_11630, partial [Cyanobacteria bacterium REEB65]|nr:hypothetical protein [Cyanobacteria bacterium REEB65]